VPLLVTAGVTVREGRKGATEATEDKENGAEGLVAGVAFTTVGQNGVQELENKNCSRWEKLYEASK